jgi:cell division protein FtsB
MIESNSMIDIFAVVEMQRETVERWHHQTLDNPFPETSFLAAVCCQHQFNFLLWHQEDIARRRDVSDSEIANVKRAIDSYNQQRNDWIETIDNCVSNLVDRLKVTLVAGALMNTETPGSTIDRLSILSLRIYHLREQLERTDVDQQHREKVSQKLSICETQKDDLATAAGQLISDIFAGRKRHRTYQQLKMYNDPTLNPALYRTSTQDSSAG